MFKKGKLYTIVGIDGILISRTKGIELYTDEDTLKNLNLDKVEDDIYDAITIDPDAFLDSGYAPFAEVVRDEDTGEYVVVAIDDDYDTSDDFDSEDEDDFEDEDEDEENKVRA